MSGRQAGKNIGKRSGLVLLLIVSVLSTQSKPQTLTPEPALSRDRPLLEIDLRNYGYKPQVPVGRHDYWSLAFSDTDDLVIGWTTLDNPGGYGRKGYLTPAPSHLHALVIDVRTGHKKDIQEWPASTFYATINPVVRGRFLACTGNAIQRFLHDFVLVREQRLSRVGPCIRGQVSPSGRSFSAHLVPTLSCRSHCFSSVLRVQLF
jgi:hypothetical protein